MEHTPIRPTSPTPSCVATVWGAGRGAETHLVPAGESGWRATSCGNVAEEHLRTGVSNDHCYVVWDSPDIVSVSPNLPKICHTQVHHKGKFVEIGQRNQAPLWVSKGRQKRRAEEERQGERSSWAPSKQELWARIDCGSKSLQEPRDISGKTLAFIQDVKQSLYSSCLHLRQQDWVSQGKLTHVKKKAEANQNPVATGILPIPEPRVWL